MPVKVVIYASSMIEVHETEYLNTLKATRYVSSGIPELDNEASIVPMHGPNKRESLVRAVVRERTNMPIANARIHGSPTKALSLLRTEKNRHAGILAQIIMHWQVDLTSLSRSGRNDVSTVGFLPSFLFLTTGGGAVIILIQTLRLYPTRVAYRIFSGGGKSRR